VELTADRVRPGDQRRCGEGAQGAKARNGCLRFFLRAPICTERFPIAAFGPLPPRPFVVPCQFTHGWKHGPAYRGRECALEDTITRSPRNRSAVADSCIAIVNYKNHSPPPHPPPPPPPTSCKRTSEFVKDCYGRSGGTDAAPRKSGRLSIRREETWIGPWLTERLGG